MKSLTRNILPLIKQLDIIFVIDKLIQQVDQVEIFPFMYNGLDWLGNIHILSSSERRTLIKYQVWKMQKIEVSYLYEQ